MSKLNLALPNAIAELIPAVAVQDPKSAPALHWGIVGPGGIAHKFARNVTDGTAGSVVAVGSRELARAEAFAAAENVPYAVGSYQELCQRDDIDAVYVATPHSAHLEAAQLAIAAGKPVLVEKAFTRNATEARELVAAARAAGTFLMEAMWTRFLPHHVVARALTAAGAIGEVVSVVADHGQRLTHVPRLITRELAGGALLDLGVYPISFIHSLLGAPSEIHSYGKAWETGVDATSVTHMGYPNAVAVATTSLVSTTPTRAFIGGSGGSIEFDRLFYTPGGLRVRIGEGQPIQWDGVPTVGGFEFQIAEVARCVAAGEPESAVLPLAHSIAIMETMDEVRRQLGASFPGED